MKIYHFIITILFLNLTLYVNGQSISKPWYSEKKVICLTLDSNSNSCTINDFDRMKFKKKENKLKITWSVKQTIFGWQKERYWFEINKLSDDSLKLTLLNNFDKALTEILGGDTVYSFIAMPLGCDSLFIKHLIKLGEIKLPNKTGNN